MQKVKNTKFRRLSKAQLELLDKLLNGWEIQVDYSDARYTNYDLISETGEIAPLSIGTFLCLKKYDLVKLKYSPSIDVERWG